MSQGWLRWQIAPLRLWSARLRVRAPTGQQRKLSLYLVGSQGLPVAQSATG